MSVVTPHQTDLTTSCKFKRDPRLRRALHLLLNRTFITGSWSFPKPSDRMQSGMGLI
jgi:hypothetical protein